VTDNNQAITTTEDGTDSEDEEWREHMAHHHHAPPECPYCHNCRPIVEEVYYMAADGEVFYRDRLVCQTDTSTADARSSNTRLQAMRTVYSSNVRRKTPYQGEQPVQTPQLQATLSAEVEINGVKALALFDTGSTTDSVTLNLPSQRRQKHSSWKNKSFSNLDVLVADPRSAMGHEFP
jgi:hypothetical protein